MSVAYVFFLFLSLLFGVVAYIASNNIVISASIAFSFIFALLFIAIPMMKRYAEKQRKRHECYLFCNSFLITLSVCDSIEKSFESATENASPEFQLIIDHVDSLTPKEKVDYLGGYFESDIYEMFLSVLSLYLDQGGDVLHLSSQLLEELTRIEESGESTRKESIKNMVQFITLWAMALAIMAFLRFGLNSFYSYIVKSSTYMISIIAFFAYLLFSILFYIFKFTGEMPFVFSPLLKKKAKKPKEEAHE